MTLMIFITILVEQIIIAKIIQSKISNNNKDQINKPKINHKTQTTMRIVMLLKTSPFMILLLKKMKLFHKLKNVALKLVSCQNTFTQLIQQVSTQTIIQTS